MIKFISAPFGNYIKSRNATSVSGSWTLNRRPGRFSQVFKTVRYRTIHKGLVSYGGWVNKLGLRNQGILHGVRFENHDEVAGRNVLSIAAIDDGDWEKFNQIIPQHYSIELNLSCPNVAEVGIDASISVMLSKYRRWCIAKVSPLSSKEEIDFIIGLGFNQIHASNAVPDSTYGAISGTIVKKYSLRIIEHIKKKHSHVQVIAGGGIHSVSDIDQYRNAGADHVSFGSVCFTPWRLPPLIGA
jgi:dihydroorotate dehydrogenase